jgi:tetratricopeptide (TPR) repeat protein/O-antigen ligase
MKAVKIIDKGLTFFAIVSLTHSAARIILGLVLVGSALIVSLSPLGQKYIPTTWGSVALGSAVGLVFMWRSRWNRHPFHLTDLIFLLAMISQIASATAQSLTAINLPSPHLPLFDTPGIETLYLVLAGLLAFSATTLIQVNGVLGLRYAALMAAAVFSSSLYIHSFTVAEAGPVYGAIFAFSIIGLASEQSLFTKLFSPTFKQFVLWSILFLTAVLLASLFSPALGQSLDYWARLTVVIVLSISMGMTITRLRTWYYAIWLLVLIAGLLPFLLSVGKYFSLVDVFGPTASLFFRFHPTEMGGANLVARSVLVVAPVALALGLFPASSSFGIPKILTGSHRARRTLGITGFTIWLGSLFVVLYSQSWGGFFAWLVAHVGFGVLVSWNKLSIKFQQWSANPFKKIFVIAGALLPALTLLVVAAWIAPRLNIVSFNGRLMHWHGALLAWRDHIWVGGGPGVETLYTPYAQQVQLFLNTQSIIDDPLFVLKHLDPGILKTHSHNLLLEIGSGSGLLGLISFVGLLIVLMIHGFSAYRRTTGWMRILIAACLAGIMGELAWSTLDVLWVTPPFFSFPTWGLVGLILAAGKFHDMEQSEQQGLSIPSRINGFGQWLWVAGAVWVIFVPALISTNYASGFLAFQQQRWDAAIVDLQKASRYAPLNSQIPKLLAKAYLEKRDFMQATLNYERAYKLKLGDVEILSQLGWLAWWDGDIHRAEDLFLRAIALDPKEAWLPGLHANLGMLYISQGYYDRSIQMLKTTIQLHPESVMANYWQALRASDGSIVIALDPVYMSGTSDDIDERILANLGVSYSDQLCCVLDPVTISLLPLTDVLDAIDVDYQVARQQINPAAPLLLAARAEAARLVGLTGIVEDSYQEYQKIQPHSAYGFRDLGVYYWNQERLPEAQAYLEKAVSASPRDVAAKYHLALVYMEQSLFQNANRVLDDIQRLLIKPNYHSYHFDPQLHIAYARYFKSVGLIDQAVDAQAKTGFIQGMPSNAIAIAQLYQQQGKMDKAYPWCLEAMDMLLGSWTRSYATELWEIAVCLAQTSSGLVETIDKISVFAEDEPLIGALILGHINRLNGMYEQALDTYERAALIRSNDGAPHFFLGETYQALGQPDQAEYEYRLANKLNPYETQPLLALSRMDAKHGKIDLAIETLQSVIDISPCWDEAHTLLGNAFFSIGNLERAYSHYEHAMLLGKYKENQGYDFGVNLALSAVQSPGPNYVYGDYFTIGEKRQRVLFMHPPATVRFTDVDVESDAVLKFSIALSPPSWTEEGDGVTFLVSVISDDGSYDVFSAYIDPKSNMNDRQWHSYQVSLAEYSGQIVDFVLETTPGPAGDDRFDWAGWGNMEIVYP